MINVAICDDEEAIVNSYRERIKALFDYKHIEVKISTYTDGNRLIEACRKQEINLVFLDIEMPTISGFEVAETINKINEDTIIIFVTSEEQLVFRSLRYSPFRFLRKNYFAAELNEAIISVLDLYMKRNKTQLFTSIDGELVVINIRDIKYIESNKHKVTIYSKDKELVSKVKISELEENLKEYGFIRVHIGYLVNMKYIFSVERTDILLADRTRVPMSRHRVEQVKTEFQKYIRSDM